MKRVFLAAILLLMFLNIYADGDAVGVNGSRHFRLRYVVNVVDLDSTFVDNSERMTDIREFLTEVKNDSLITIDKVYFRGTASPEGPYENNLWLSENRLRTFKELINQYVTIPDSIIFAQSSDIPWDEFRQKVAESDIEKRDRVLEIIDEGPKLVPFWGGRHIDHRLLKLQKLDGGKVWKVLKDPILFNLRYGDAVIYYTTLIPLPGLAISYETSVPVAVLPDLEFPVDRPQLATWTPNIYLKTNLVEWAAGSVNLGAEFDLGPHWSFNFPITYCAWDYFKSTIKFRNFSIQPEFRYWPDARGYNHGFFVGAHFGAMAYNFAIDGKYRYQDRKGKHPALGGGVAVGFRKPITKNNRWHVEFSAGAGCYYLDYDVFENTPNYKEGKWVRRKQKTWFGLDQLNISIDYCFPLTGRQKTMVKGGGL